MENLRPNAQRAKTAIILIWVVLGLEMVSLVSSGLQYHLLQTVANGGSITPEEANANDIRERVIGIVALIAQIVSAVTFIRWFRRAYYNLSLKTNLNYTDGWAAGSWFIPILNLFRPYQLVKELHQETKTLLTEKEETGYHQPYSMALLGWWWTIWLIHSFVGQFIFQYARKASTVDDYIITTTASIAAHLITIPLALVTVKIITDYSRAEAMLGDVQLKPVAIKSEDVIDDIDFSSGA